MAPGFAIGARSLEETIATLTGTRAGIVMNLAKCFLAQTNGRAVTHEPQCRSTNRNLIMADVNKIYQGFLRAEQLGGKTRRATIRQRPLKYWVKAAGRKKDCAQSGRREATFAAQQDECAGAGGNTFWPQSGHWVDGQLDLRPERCCFRARWLTPSRARRARGTGARTRTSTGGMQSRSVMRPTGEWPAEVVSDIRGRMTRDRNAAANPVLTAALRWIRKGAADPGALQAKESGRRRLGATRLTAAEVSTVFSTGPLNIGVLWGAPSGGLVDCDLDWREAEAIAPALLPSTAVYGRASSRRSHWFYQVRGDEAVDVTEALVPEGTATSSWSACRRAQEFAAVDAQEQ